MGAFFFLEVFFLEGFFLDAFLPEVFLSEVFLSEVFLPEVFFLDAFLALSHASGQIPVSLSVLTSSCLVVTSGSNSNFFLRSTTLRPPSVRVLPSGRPAAFLHASQSRLLVTLTAAFFLAGIKKKFFQQKPFFFIDAKKNIGEC